MQAHVVSSVGMGNHAQGHLGDSAGRRSTTSIELCTHGATSQSEPPSSSQSSLHGPGGEHRGPSGRNPINNACIDESVTIIGLESADIESRMPAARISLLTYGPGSARADLGQASSCAAARQHITEGLHCQRWRMHRGEQGAL